MHTDGCGAAIYIEKPGASVRVKTWTPFNGPSLGYLVTHHEAISIADFLTLRTADETYRPTVHYAYRPSDEAILSVHEWFGNDCMTPERQKYFVLVISCRVLITSVFFLWGTKNLVIGMDLS